MYSTSSAFIHPGDAHDVHFTNPNMGPATDPMSIGKPCFDMAHRRLQVKACVHKKDALETFENVLMQHNDDDHDHDEHHDEHDHDDQPKCAHAPMPSNELTRLLTGHVKFCHVLELHNNNNNNNNKTTDEEEEEEEEESNNKVIFQLTP